MSTRGFGLLPCPRCGVKAAIAVYLNQFALLRCGDCEDTFRLDEVAAFIQAWQPVLEWLLKAPERGA